jgi:hypothetical protein
MFAVRVNGDAIADRRDHRGPASAMGGAIICSSRLERQLLRFLRKLS